MTNLDKAREWAKLNIDGGYFRPGNRALDAAEIIQSLPDQWVDVEEVRKLLDRWSANPFPSSDEVAVLNDVKALIAPELPTLADMTPEEREACRWMQCKVETDDEDTIGVIWMIWSNRVHIIFQSGIIFDAESRKVTPLPDLPKLEWPSGGVDAEIVEEPEPANPDPIHTPMQPSEVPANEPWLIEADGQKLVGARYQGNAFAPWSVAALDGLFAGDYNDNEITLIHKLVPEPPALPEGMRLADHKKYGLVVVSPGVDTDGDHKFLRSDSINMTGASWGYVNKSKLTFLDGGN